MIWSILAGIAVLLGVAADVLATVVVPRARGPLSVRVYRVAWHLIQHLPAQLRAALTPHAGPGSIIATIAMWLAGLWGGYALIYLPFVARLAYSPDVHFGKPGPFDALYLSGKQIARELPGDPDRAIADQAAATATVTAVRAAVRALDPALAAGGPVPPAAADLLSLAETAIGGYAAMHGFPHRTPHPDTTGSSYHWLLIPLRVVERGPPDIDPDALTRFPVGGVTTLRDGRVGVLPELHALTAAPRQVGATVVGVALPGACVVVDARPGRAPDVPLVDVLPVPHAPGLQGGGPAIAAACPGSALCPRVVELRVAETGSHRGSAGRRCSARRNEPRPSRQWLVLCADPEKVVPYFAAGSDRRDRADRGEDDHPRERSVLEESRPFPPFLHVSSLLLGIAGREWLRR